MRVNTISATLGLAAFVCADGVPLAHADMVVLESTEPSIQSGSRIPGTTIDTRAFAKCAHVRVLVLDIQATKDFVGPLGCEAIPGAVGGTREPR